VLTKASVGWLVYACRTSYTPEVVEIIWRRNEPVVVMIDNLEPDPSVGEPIMAEVEQLLRNELDDSHRELDVTIPLLTPGYRFAVVEEALELGLRRFPALVDPTAVVARTSTIASGAVINAGTVIAARTTIGRFVHVNRSASVGHDNVLDDFATLGPGCVLAGHVHVERGAFIGAGAVCAPQVTIGANAVVGAGAVVVGDVRAGTVVVGNPAKILRESPGYADVAVPPLP
jgi:sugar O-acyltransferase (sialic acid O-acetyltransferase NeuD family)